MKNIFLKSITIERLPQNNEAKKRLLHLLKLLDSTYIPPISTILDLETYCNKLHELAIILVAHYNGIDIGFIAFYANDLEHKSAFISSIGIKPEFRGSHIGNILIDQVVEIATENNMSKIELEVNTQNIRAQNFYI